MKKWAAALAAALLVPAAAGAVSPAELSDTSKYKPVYMSETGVVYAELASIKTGDPVKGQLPLIQANILPQAGEAQALTLTGEAQDLYLNLYRLL